MAKTRSLSTSLLALAIAVACIPWYAYVATVVWSWFVVPLGVHAIGKAHAYGLMVLVSLTRPYDPTEDNRELWDKVAHSALTPALILLVGYICHRWM